MVRTKLGSPVLFKQERPGQIDSKTGKERIFKLYKFRTMTDARDSEGNLLKDSERLTKFGSFLRKTSLDEIPQLFNVFSGEMALIGPRPIVEKEVPYYGRDYTVFSSVKPGITGLWQASGRSDTDYDQRVALDVQYVLNWSPWLDVWIIIKTACSVLLMRGAC